MRRLTLAAALGALALALGVGHAQAPQKVVFALNWFAVGDHAAYWVAIEKGYYRGRGLEVELQNSKGSGDSIAKVDTGRADLGLADAVVVIPRLAQGAKIKIVGAVFDHTPLNIFTRKDTGITKPKDLEGKTLAAPPGDSQRQLFPAFARLNGVDASKVNWLNIEPAAKMVALAEKRADAIPDYTTGQPLFENVFAEKGLPKDTLVRMPWNKFGIDAYSMSIIASEKSLKDRPQMVRDFLAASYMGWREVMNNPRAAMEIFKKRVPEINAAVIEANLHLGLELMRTERYAKNGIGWMDRDKMCRTVDLINTYMDMPRKVACTEAFTNDFLTKIEPPAR
jgi:NitT/TauT family transport system substrate-binding protein